jgi:hypothetical protein
MATIQKHSEYVMHAALLTAVGNNLQFDSGGKGTHCCTSMATPNTFALLAATFNITKIKKEGIVALQ